MKKITGLFSLLSVIILFATTAAFAATYPNEAAGIALTIPDSWKVEPKGDILQAEVNGDTLEDNLSMVFEVVKGENIVTALDEAQKTITNEFGVLKTENTAEVEINGMKAFIEDSTAKEGKISVSIILIETPAKKYMLVYYFAAPEAERKHEREINEIINGIKPIVKK